MPAGDAASALVVCAGLSALGTLVIASENVAAVNLFGDRGLLSWNSQQTSLSWPRGTRRLADLVLGRLWRGLLFGRVALAAAVIALSFAGPSLHVLLGVSLVGLAMTQILSFARSPYGHDGAEQMGLVVQISAGLGLTVPGPHVAEISLGFIAAQSILSYIVSGSAKLLSPTWRSGEAMPGILTTHTYGTPSFGRLLVARPVASRWMARSVIAFEISFLPLVLSGQPFWVSCALLAGFCFHVGNAVLMGLNTFLWHFLSTYPALWFFASQRFFA